MVEGPKEIFVPYPYSLFQSASKSDSEPDSNSMVSMVKYAYHMIIH